jgi:hypothetical protein
MKGSARRDWLLLAATATGSTPEDSVHHRRIYFQVYLTILLHTPPTCAHRDLLSTHAVIAIPSVLSYLFIPACAHLDPIAMDLNEASSALTRLFHDANEQFHKVPGSAILLRYIKSSYQNDPVRSAIELFLFLFAVRYLLAPTYSTKKTKAAVLTEEVSCAFI